MQSVTWIEAALVVLCQGAISSVTTVRGFRQTVRYGTGNPVLPVPARPEEKNFPYFLIPARPVEKIPKAVINRLFRFLYTYYLSKQRIKRN